MSSHDMMNPPGEVPLWRVVGSPVPSDDHLLERILDRTNMREAWKQGKGNKGAAGIDKMTVDDFEAFARKNWPHIRHLLLAGTYHPSPVLRVEIPKSTGDMRPLGIPTVTDRVIQQAIAQVLTPIFDPDFSEFSFGFRSGRSAHDAVRQVQEYIGQGYRTAVDMDLRKFFDMVNHDVLMYRVARKVHDKRTLRLIGKYLRAGVVVNGRLQQTRKGVPQGGPLSPLLANILLDDLDKGLERRGHKFVRYADDFVVLVKSHRAGQRVMASVSRFVERILKQQINEGKSQVSTTNQIEYLGFIFKGSKIRWSDKAFREFKRQVKRLTGRSWFVSMKYRLSRLKKYIRGWMNYYGISEYYRPIPEIDHWLRRRIRMCYWKQWRYARTKIRNLLKLGTHPGVAIPMSLSRKGPWNGSRTLATQTGMTNQWLKDQGLISVKEQWVKIHYSRQGGTR